MNELRRKIVLAVPLAPLVGLSACGGGDEAAADRSPGTQPDSLQAQALGTVNGLGLTTSAGTSRKLDSVFTAYTDLKVILPDSTPTTQSCLNGITLHVALTEEIRGYRRSVLLKLGNPALNKSYALSTLPDDDALLVINGGPSNTHHEYRLKSGSIMLAAYDARTNQVTLSFSNVQGQPTPVAVAPGNAAAQPVILNGRLASVFRPETAAWMA